MDHLHRGVNRKNAHIRHSLDLETDDTKTAEMTPRRKELCGKFVFSTREIPKGIDESTELFNDIDLQAAHDKPPWNICTRFSGPHAIANYPPSQGLAEREARIPRRS